MIRRINHCLNPTLSQLCLKAAVLEGLKEKIANFLPASLKSAVKVGNFHKGSLNLLISDANAATSLRFLIPELRDRLRNEAGIYQLIAINCALAEPEPVEQKQQSHKPIRKLSSKACSNIKNSIDALSYEPLKEALLKLSTQE